MTMEDAKMNEPFEADLSGAAVGGCPGASGGEIATPAMSNQAVHRQIEAGDVPVLKLNDRWRLAHDGRLQWILQYRYGKAATAWRGRRFHVERDSLLRSIAELCGLVDQAAIETIKGWSPRYRPDFSRQAGVTTLLPMAAE